MKKWPVGDGIASIFHAFCLSVGRGDRAAVEMVAADDDRCGNLAVPHHLIEGQAEAVPLSKADPTDTRRESLKGDALSRHVEPAVKVRIIGHQFLYALVGSVDVLGIGRDGCAAERADAAAEQR